MHIDFFDIQFYLDGEVFPLIITQPLPQKVPKAKLGYKIPFEWLRVILKLTAFIISVKTEASLLSLG